MVLPSIVVPVGDGGQVVGLKIAHTRIHCSNISQGIVPDLQKKITEIDRHDYTNLCSNKGIRNLKVYHLSHVSCWRLDTSSDGIVVEEELINVIFIEIQAGRLDQWWHDKAQTNSSAQQ